MKPHKKHLTMSQVLALPRANPPTLRLRDYLLAQLTAPMQDEVQQAKHERVYNFLHVPQKLEQLLVLGYFVCLDSFLYNFTILPVRILISLASFLLASLCRTFRRREPSRKLPFFPLDLLRGLLVLSVCVALQQIDASRLYHSIRGQSVIKLYVIFNVFEVLDKLCCSFGLDILDSFFSKDVPREGTSPSARLSPIVHYALTICYVFIHTMVLFFQAITLNVSINSFSNALLTLLVSNQFVEIKSAVFKKFEKENLFQLSCADILERFQLSVYLLIIGFRNLTEASASLDSEYIIFGLVSPLALILLSEVLVDWLKHAFITKFNHIHPDVYLRFMDTLSRDFESSSLADQSPAVSRRIGFSSFPLACLLIRILAQMWTVSERTLVSALPMLLAVFLVLFILKILLGMALIQYTANRNAACDYRMIKAEPGARNQGLDGMKEKAQSADIKPVPSPEETLPRKPSDVQEESDATVPISSPGSSAGHDEINKG